MYSETLSKRFNWSILANSSAALQKFSSAPRIPRARHANKNPAEKRKIKNISHTLVIKSMEEHIV